jgi:hypothetical protein
VGSTLVAIAATFFSNQTPKQVDFFGVATPKALPSPAGLGWSAESLFDWEAHRLAEEGRSLMEEAASLASRSYHRQTVDKSLPSVPDVDMSNAEELDFFLDFECDELPLKGDQSPPHLSFSAAPSHGGQGAPLSLRGPSDHIGDMTDGMPPSSRVSPVSTTSSIETPECLKRPLLVEKRTLAWSNEVLDLPIREVNTLVKTLSFSEKLQQSLRQARRRRKSCFYSEDYRRNQKLKTTSGTGGKMKSEKRPLKAKDPAAESDQLLADLATEVKKNYKIKTVTKEAADIFEHERTLMQKELARLRAREIFLEQQLARYELRR